MICINFNRSFNLYIGNFLIELHFIFIAFILILIVLLYFWSYSGGYSFYTFWFNTLFVLRRFWTNRNITGFIKCFFEQIVIWHFQIKAHKLDIYIYIMLYYKLSNVIIYFMLMIHAWLVNIYILTKLKSN